MHAPVASEPRAPAPPSARAQSSEPRASAALERVKYVLAQLPRDDQAALAEFLAGLLVTPEEAERMLDPTAERVVATVTTRVRLEAGGARGREPTITYRLERVRCGKSGCTKCPHGPYVYKYWREGGRLRKQYAGRPRDTLAERDARHAEARARAQASNPAASTRARAALAEAPRAAAPRAEVSRGAKAASPDASRTRTKRAPATPAPARAIQEPLA